MVCGLTAGGRRIRTLRRRKRAGCPKGKGDDPAHREMPMTKYLLIESRDPFDSNDVRFCGDLAQQPPTAGCKSASPDHIIQRRSRPETAAPSISPCLPVLAVNSRK